MNRHARRLTAALCLCLLLTGVTASAKVRSRTVAFSQDITVGGTLIKSGVYLLSFDDKTNELTIAANKSREVVAKVSARAERRETAPKSTDLQVARQGDAMVLTGVTFSGEKWAINIGSAGRDAAGN